MTEVSKEDFHEYCAIRRSGKINMISSEVQDMVGIDKKTHFYIMKNYDELEKKYGQPDS